MKLSAIGKYKKKPVVIDACLYDHPATFHYPDWLLEAACRGEVLTREDDGLSIKTLEGTMVATPGDWIIRGVAGEIYPCKPDIFEATYEAVEEQ